MKETKEFLLFITKIILKTIENQKDGWQLSDLLTYITDLKDAPAAFTGLGHIKTEFQLATHFDIYGLADEIRRAIADQLGGNADPLLTETIVSAVTTVLLTYATIAKGKQD
jgi:hypothetical protein